MRPRTQQPAGLQNFLATPQTLLTAKQNLLIEAFCFPTEELCARAAEQSKQAATRNKRTEKLCLPNGEQNKQAELFCAASTRVISAAAAFCAANGSPNDRPVRRNPVAGGGVAWGMGDLEHVERGNRRSHSMPVALLTVILAVVGLVLAWGLAGWTWGLVFPVLLPAAVPLWTQQREVKHAAALAAKRAAAGAGHVADLANAEHDPDPTPTHGGLVKVAVSLVLLAAALAFAVVQVRTEQEAGWWLVASCGPLFVFFWYAARQWCRQKSEARIVAYGLAAWTVGLSGNFTASAITRGTCADHAETKLAAVLNPIGDGVTYLVGWTKEKDKRDEEDAAKAAEMARKLVEMDRKLDEIARGQMSAKGGDGASSVVTLNVNEIDALDKIRAEGNPLQQARAIVLLAADRRSTSLWAEADDAIKRLESDRERGMWKGEVDQERFLLLKGDRKFHADDPDGAISFFEAAVAAFPRSAEAWNMLGRSHREAKKGDTKEHWSAARDAYESALGVIGVDDPIAGTVHSNLALIQQAQGDPSGARANIERAIAIDQKHFAPDHPAFAIIYSNLATIQHDQGDLPGARASMERAIAIAEKNLGPEHPNLAAMRSNLAMIQHDQRDLARARANMERAIAIGQKHFAPDHPSFATWYSNLAGIQMNLGDLPGARANVERAIAIDQKHFAPDHPIFATRYSNLSAIQHDQRDLPGARSSMERAIAIAQKHFAPDHPTFATSYINLATICHAEGNRPEAAKNFRKALRILLKHSDENHPHVKLARRLMQQGGYTE